MGMRNAWKGVLPDSFRIRLKLRRGKDVIRNGVWLNKQVCREEPFADGGPGGAAGASQSNVRERRTPVLDSWEREQMLRRLLERYEFAFDRMLILQNPFRLSPLTAVLVFETKERCVARITVRGDEREHDFSYTAGGAARQHFVPVIGLYADRRNVVEVALCDGKGKVLCKRNVEITTGPLPDKMTNLIRPLVVPKGNRDWSLMFVTGGIKGFTYAFDPSGEIRWYLAHLPKQYGVCPLGHGKFYYPDRQINCPTYINSHSCVMYEMDALGRVHETCYVDGGFHHWLEEKPGSDGREVFAAASSLKERMEDQLIRYDTETGRILQKWDLGEIFPDKFTKRRKDWAHFNSFCFYDNDNVIVSLRNLHTVAKIDLRKFEVVWAAAPPDIYQETEFKEKLLQPAGEEFHWFFQQHAVRIVERDAARGLLSIVLFDNHCTTKRRSLFFDGREESFGCRYEIDENKRTIRSVWTIPCELSPTRSNVCCTEKGRSVYVMAGAAGATDYHDSAFISGWDMDRRELSCKYSVAEGYFRAHPMEPGAPEKIAASLRKPLRYPEKLHRGQLRMPVRDDNCSDVVYRKCRIPGVLKITRMEDLILIYAQDHKVEKVFFSGKDSVWMLDFTDTYQVGDVFGQMVYSVAVPVDPLPSGRYRIRLRYDGEYYDTGKWFYR